MTTKRKKSRKRSFCKHGKLKRPVKTRRGRKRMCKKTKRKSKKRKSKKRKKYKMLNTLDTYEQIKANETDKFKINEGIYYYPNQITPLKTNTSTLSYWLDRETGERFWYNPREGPNEEMKKVIDFKNSNLCQGSLPSSRGYMAIRGKQYPKQELLYLCKAFNYFEEQDKKFKDEKYAEGNLTDVDLQKFVKVIKLINKQPRTHNQDLSKFSKDFNSIKHLLNFSINYLYIKNMNIYQLFNYLEHNIFKYQLQQHIPQYKNSYYLTSHSAFHFKSSFRIVPPGCLVMFFTPINRVSKRNQNQHNNILNILQNPNELKNLLKYNCRSSKDQNDCFKYLVTYYPGDIYIDTIFVQGKTQESERRIHGLYSLPSGDKSDFKTTYLSTLLEQNPGNYFIKACRVCKASYLSDDRLNFMYLYEKLKNILKGKLCSYKSLKSCTANYPLPKSIKHRTPFSRESSGELSPLEY